MGQNKVLSALEPGDRLPPRPENYEPRLVLAGPSGLTALHEEQIEHSPTSFTARCSTTGRLGGVSVHRGDRQFQEPSESSPTALYARSKTLLHWSGKSVGRGYAALCGESRDIIERHLRPFQVALSKDKIRARGLAEADALDPDHRFKRLVLEYGFKKTSTTAVREKLGARKIDEVSTVAWSDAGVSYRGVDLDVNGRLDVMEISYPEIGLNILLYDMEEGPREFQTAVPPLELGVIPRESQYRPQCHTGAKVKWVSFLHPSQTRCRPEALCFEPDGAAIGIEFLCLEPHAPPYAQIFTRNPKPPVGSRPAILDSSWPSYSMRPVSLPTLPMGHRWLFEEWQERPNMEAIWSSGSEGVVRLKLASLSASGTRQIQMFEIPMTWENQRVDFKIPPRLSAVSM